MSWLGSFGWSKLGHHPFHFIKLTPSSCIYFIFNHAGNIKVILLELFTSLTRAIRVKFLRRPILCNWRTLLTKRLVHPRFIGLLVQSFLSWDHIPPRYSLNSVSGFTIKKGRHISGVFSLYCHVAWVFLIKIHNMLVSAFLKKEQALGFETHFHT